MLDNADTSTLPNFPGSITEDWANFVAEKFGKDKNDIKYAEHQTMAEYFILILLFISCSDSIAQSEETAILHTILNTSEFKKYHHPDLKNRTPLFLLDKGQYSNTNLSQAKPKVKIVDDTTGTNGNYIKFSKLFITDGEAEFELYYKIENMHMGGSHMKKEGKWQIDEIDYVI